MFLAVEKHCDTEASCVHNGDRDDYTCFYFLPPWLL